MTNREAWEAFYKTGKISDYMTYRSGQSKAPGSATGSVTKGEDSEHATDTGWSYPAPKADG